MLVGRSLFGSTRVARRRHVIPVLFIALVSFGGCSGGRTSGGGGASSSCTSAPSAAVHAISTGLLGGTNLSRTAMVADPERQNVYLIAGEIDGPGVDGAGQVGVWATNKPSDPVVIYAVDPYAGQFSDWARLDGATLSEWELARGCL
jgi:hypothetical protein